MNDSPKPKRRWHQFSLKKLLVVMLLLFFVIAGWAGCQIAEYRYEEPAYHHFTGIGGQTGTRYCWYRHTGIQFLSLHNPEVTDRDLEPLQRLRHLRRLMLADTNVTDDGLRHLSNLDRLYELDLRNTHVTDAGLTSLYQLKGLKTLWLTGTSVTREGVAELMDQLPQLETVSTDAIFWASGIEVIEVVD